MGKIQILGAAFFAVLAFGAIAAASASASEEWLVGGKLVGATEKVSAVTSGKWLLLATFLGIKFHVVCNGELIGTVNGLNASGLGTDTIELVTNLTLTEKDLLLCKVLSAEPGPCVAGATAATVHAEHLPWLSELFLEAGDTKSRDKFKSSGAGLPAFKVECKKPDGTTFVELCESEVKSDQLVNNGTAGDIDGTITNQKVTKCNNALGTATIYGTGFSQDIIGGNA